MSAVVRIEPTHTEIPGAAAPLWIAEIRLGGVPRGAVVVLCEAGARGPDPVEVMNGLAEHGYESVATLMAPGPDSGGAAGGGAETAEDAGGLVRDVVALVARLSDRGWGPEQTGILGYGLGGRVALMAAAEYEFGAAVSVAPKGVTQAVAQAAPTPAGLARSVRTPWLGLLGGRDEDEPAFVRELEAALRAESPVYTEIVPYPVSAELYTDAASSVAHAASFDAWQRTIEWLNRRVAPRLTPLAEAWLARQRKSVTA